MKLPIAYYINKRSKAFRLWYHKNFDGRYYWGLFQFTRDYCDDEPKEPLTTAMVEKLWDDLDFSNRK